MSRLNGRVKDCKSAAKECGYRCCDQDKIDGSINICHQDYIMLYPGEWEAAKQPKEHICIISEDFFGGKLGRCKREVFNQSECSHLKNFKSMDCHTYPFAPRIDDGGRVYLVIDQRCPLSSRNQLGKHYHKIQKEWEELVDSNPEVAVWIKSFELPGYTKYLQASSREHQELA